MLTRVREEASERLSDGHRAGAPSNSTGTTREHEGTFTIYLARAGPTPGTPTSASNSLSLTARPNGPRAVDKRFGALC